MLRASVANDGIVGKIRPMTRPRPIGVLLLPILGGGGGATAAFSTDELAGLAAREAASPELLQFTGGDGGLVLLAVICVVLTIGLVITEAAHGD